MWSLVLILGEDREEIPDLIPNVWLKNQNECWYPIEYKTSKINTLAKNKTQPNHKDWTVCQLKLVERDIGNS